MMTMTCNVTQCRRSRIVLEFYTVTPLPLSPYLFLALSETVGIIIEARMYATSKIVSFGNAEKHRSSSSVKKKKKKQAYVSLGAFQSICRQCASPSRARELSFHAYNLYALCIRAFT